MAFFKFRKAADEPTPAPPAPQSVEAMRQRAKYRLVGSSVLVLLGVIGFPLLFDKQPRPIAVDTPIDIPDRNKVAPLTLPAASEAAPASAPAIKPVASSPVAVAASSAPAPTDEPGVITETAQPAKTAKSPEKKQAQAVVQKASQATKNVAAEVPKPVKPTKPDANTAASRSAEAAKAKALLDGKAADAPAATAGRFIVQVGAFSDGTRAHEVRVKLERAGLKTYTHVADTKDGKRIRVRVGPFSARADAEKAAEKVKKLSLPAALLTL